MEATKFVCMCMSLAENVVHKPLQRVIPVASVLNLLSVSKARAQNGH